MRLTPLINPGFVSCPLKGRSKEDVVHELAALVARSPIGILEKEIIETLQARERQGPFSMGKGLAFLHARTEKVKDFTLGIGTSPSGLDFGAPDGRPVRLVILMVVPKKHSNLYLYAMASFLNLFSNESNMMRASVAQSASDLVRFFDELEGNVRQKSPLEELLQPTPFLRLNQTIAQAVDVVLANKVDQIPVVSASEELVGEITLTSLLRLATSPERDRKLEEIGANALQTPRVVVQDSTALSELAERLSRESTSVAYVVRGKRLIGQVNPVELLRRMMVR
jgi:mannitol/fructose-specific phosphotransferase system IIA component (Ntr-type)